MWHVTAGLAAWEVETTTEQGAVLMNGSAMHTVLWNTDDLNSVQLYG
jgi:hypothetical protein